MITAARLQACASPGDVFELLRALGYQVQPVPIDPAEWRGAGIDITWPDHWALHVAARSEQLDCYVLAGDVLPSHEAASKFLQSLQAYNVLRKPVLIAAMDGHVAVYDLSPHRDLRRLEIDLRNPSAHALDRLNLLTTTTNDAARLFERALDRETLTRQFFERFRHAVQEVAGALRAQYGRESNEAIAAEALLILSRLLFLYFVQQRGWLNGERRFIVDRLEAALQSGHQFYAHVLAPLFFACLNTPLRDRDLPPRLLGNIPYLNGGLFEPSVFELRHPDISLPNELMQRVINDVFERFAFSIDESDSAGSHVDPEMLGKVFESLMAEDERAASGSFYTPRPIVDALTSRAVRQWCGRNGAHETLRRLERIAVLDPACGSGAFLLSALRVIEELIAAASAEAGLDVDPNLRQAIVERSLFGVDLKPEAVRLCELRLWLAIVSKRSMAPEAVPPLPNLDRNILQGNSLLSPLDFLGDGRGEVYRQWLMALRAQADLIARYRNAPQGERPALARLMRSSDQRLAAELLARAVDIDERELQELAAPQKDLFGRLRPMNLARCRELHLRLSELRRLLARVEEGELDFFSYDVHFAHVMARGGFDVVIGNPPWVRNSRIDPRAKRMYGDRYRLFRASSTRNAAFHQPDLSIVFFERALSLTSPAGMVSLLMPAKVMNAAYAAPLRRAAEAQSIVALDDWSAEARRFFDADTFPLGVTIARQRRRANVEITCDGESFTAPQQSLSLAGSEWSLVPPAVRDVISRLYGEDPPLHETLRRRPVMGVKSGDNSSFFLDVVRFHGDAVETRDHLRIPLSAVARCVRGRDIARWEIHDAAWMILPPRGGWERIPRWLERFAASRKLDPDDLQIAYLRPEHLGIKVVWKDLSRGICAAVLRDHELVGGRRVPLLPNQTLYALEAGTVDEAQVMAAILNSTVVNALAVCVAERAKDFHYRYFGRTISRVPLPLGIHDRAIWQNLLRLARKAPQSAADIDRLIAGVYCVTPDEQTRLSAFLQRRLGKAVSSKAADG